MLDTAFILIQDFSLLAQRSAPKKPSGALDMKSVTMLILGVAIVAVFAVIAYYVGSYLRKGAVEKDKPPSLTEHLAAFREAQDDGSMTALEFAAVKKHLSLKIMDEVKQDNVMLQASDFRLQDEDSNVNPEA